MLSASKLITNGYYYLRSIKLVKICCPVIIQHKRDREGGWVRSVTLHILGPVARRRWEVGGQPQAPAASPPECDPVLIV